MIDIGDKRWFTAYTLEDLAAYLPRRYTQRERLRLRSLEVSGWRGDQAQFVLTLNRTAADLGPELGGSEHLAVGKGAFDCEQQTFVVWSMAMQNR